jgi:hypothetical protein
MSWRVADGGTHAHSYRNVLPHLLSFSRREICQLLGVFLAVSAAIGLPYWVPYRQGKLSHFIAPRLQRFRGQLWETSYCCLNMFVWLYYHLANHKGGLFLFYFFCAHTRLAVAMRGRPYGWEKKGDRFKIFRLIQLMPWWKILSNLVWWPTEKQFCILYLTGT